MIEEMSRKEEEGQDLEEEIIWELSEEEAGQRSEGLLTLWMSMSSKIPSRLFHQ